MKFLLCKDIGFLLDTRMQNLLQNSICMLDALVEDMDQFSLAKGFIDELSNQQTANYVFYAQRAFGGGPISN